MMTQQVSASGPDLPGMSVGEALAEPVLLATGWMQSPPWALVALVILTLVLVALSNRDRSELNPSR